MMYQLSAIFKDLLINILNNLVNFLFTSTSNYLKFIDRVFQQFHEFAMGNSASMFLPTYSN